MSGCHELGSFSLDAYLRERFPIRVFLPLGCGLVAPGVLAELGEGALRPAAGLRLGLCLLLLLALRLWDDLADREHDRALHPGRHVVRTCPQAAWRVVFGLLACGLGGLAALPSPRIRVGASVCLGALLAAWYRWRPPARRQLNAALVLLKYPALVGLLWCSPLRPAWIGSFGLSYGGALAYELVHDPRLRREGAPWLVALTWLLLCLSLAAFTLEAAARGPGVLS